MGQAFLKSSKGHILIHTALIGIGSRNQETARVMHSSCADVGKAGVGTVHTT